MWTADRAIDALRRRGELLEPVPGAVGLRGDALALFDAIEQRITAAACRLAPEPWRAAQALGWKTLEDAEYFASFPQWLSAASHLDHDDAAGLDVVAGSAHPAEAARRRFGSPTAALPPAACYHVFEGLRGVRLAAPRAITLQCTCWRHEGTATRPLERGWSFTMREAVVLGDAAAVETLRREGEAAALRLAAGLGVDAELEEATDPFFRAARGKGLMQQLKGLKREVLVPLGDGRRLAVASSNIHETFFGRAFGITRPDGGPASSGCVAFGLERWLLAFLVAHGPRAASWPIHVSTRRRQEVPA